MQFSKTIVLLALAVVLSGLSAVAQVAPIPPALADEAPSGRLADDVALARATVSLLQAGDFAALRERLDRGAIGEVSDDTLRRMSDEIGTREPASVKIISARESHNLRTGEGSSRILLEYQFDSNWVVTDAVVKTVGADKRLTRLYFTVNALPLTELNAFHLFGKGLPQYLFLAGWVLTIVLTSWAIYLAFQQHRGSRRWLLIALMPLGLTPTVALNWNTAQVFVLEAISNAAGYTVPFFAVRYPMAPFGNTETGAPYLYISAPLIAVIYLIRQWARRRSASPLSSVP